MRKIKVKNQRGAKRELMRAHRMQGKAWKMMSRGDKRRGTELHRASLKHFAAAELYIITNRNEVNKELRDLSDGVMLAGIIFEDEYYDDE